MPRLRRRPTRYTPNPSLDFSARGYSSLPRAQERDAATHSNAFSPYRLLYRGALSLSDSYLLPDSVAFSARLPNHQHGYSSALVPDSPSSSLSKGTHVQLTRVGIRDMCGRPSLRSEETVCLREVWTDETGTCGCGYSPMRDADADLFRKCVVSVSAGCAAAGCVWAQADGGGSVVL
ncbi:hypothetical protein JVU11DRAFT_2070 [Chiua virens]|nr:hypothetical protein JVU11DRAFT_2070 [Chiua virens]